MHGANTALQAGAQRAGQPGPAAGAAERLWPGVALAAVRAVYETLTAVRDGVPPGKIANVASADLMRQVTREAEYDRWSGEFLGGA